MFYFDTGTSLGTVNIPEVCYGQCHGQPELAPPPPKFTCHSSIDCRDEHGLDHWMCNFDQDDSGFCEPCFQRFDNDRCIASTFATENGTNECIKVCVDGNYGDLHSSTELPTTSTVIASCSDFDLLHDFLAGIGAAHFESVFTNEQDAFSRKPGRETHGLKRRKIQFTHWIDNIFVKINWHLEKRKFRRCFEENGKLFDGGMMISKDFNQCPFIEATTIDEYFEHILNFVKWFYHINGRYDSGECASAGRYIVDTLHHRRKRINEIKMEIQAHVQSKKSQKIHNQIFQKSDE